MVRYFFMVWYLQPRICGEVEQSGADSLTLRFHGVDTTSSHNITPPWSEREETKMHHPTSGRSRQRKQTKGLKVHLRLILFLFAHHSTNWITYSISPHIVFFFHLHRVCNSLAMHLVKLRFKEVKTTQLDFLYCNFYYYS